MKLAILGFSEKGNQLCHRLSTYFAACGESCMECRLLKYMDSAEPSSVHEIYDVKDVSEWTGQQFREADGLIFVGAVGIAVRMVAPYIRSKTSDPAVVVVDELGSYAIPILSGHIGGANELAHRIQTAIGALPVITTATDINHKFAVDSYAIAHHMWISDMKLAKEISVDILSGETVGFVSEIERYHACPMGTAAGFAYHRNILISARESQERREDVLTLVPPVTVLGIGCRKGCEAHIVEEQVCQALKQADISVHSICRIATIDLKAEEAGILSLAQSLKVPFVTYSAQELNAVPGTYTSSSFVSQVTGTDNVCERAAMAATMEEGGQLVLTKTSGNGVTVAAAMILGKAEI